MKEQTTLEKLFDRGITLTDFLELPHAIVLLSYDEYGVFLTPTINGERGYFFRPGPSLKELLGYNKINIDISLWQDFINENAHSIVIRVFENKKSIYKRFYNRSKINSIKSFKNKIELDIKYFDFSECRKKTKSKLLIEKSDMNMSGK
ncbi:MAG: hypothetical protein V3V14_11515 [Saprospiraceae bacterium]